MQRDSNRGIGDKEARKLNQIKNVPVESKLTIDRIQNSDINDKNFKIY